MMSSSLHRVGRDPYVDWAIAVTQSLVTVVMLVALAGYSYVKTSTLNVTNVSAASSAKKKVFDEELLEKVLHNYDDRAREWERLRGGAPVIGDPSI